MISRRNFLTSFCVLACGSENEEPKRDKEIMPPAAVGIGRGGNLWTKPRPLSVLVPDWGQSNDLGANVIPALLPSWLVPYGEVWWWAEDSGIFYSGAGVADGSGTTGNAFIPLTTYFAGINRCPPDLGILRALTVKGIAAAAVRIAEGSTNIFSDWNAITPGPKALFQLRVNEINKALIDASLPIPSPTEFFDFVSIGETDAANATHAAAYETNWLNIRNTLQSLFPNTPIKSVISKLALNGSPAFRAIVRAAQQNIADTDPNVKIVNTDVYPVNADGLHWETQISLSIGIEAVNIQYDNYPKVIGLAEDFSNVSYWEGTQATGPIGSADMGVLATVIPRVAVTSEQQLFQRYVANTLGFRLLHRPTEVAFTAVNGALADVTATAAIVLEPGKVSQIGARMSGGLIQMFVNGVAVGAAFPIVGYTPTLNNTPYRIGRVTPAASSQTQILAIAVANSVAPTNQDFADAWTLAKATGEYSLANQTHYWYGQDAGTNWYDRIAQARTTAQGTTDFDLIIPEYAA